MTAPDSLNLDWFRTPPASHRSMPLWVWNGEMTEPRITKMLEQYAAQGMGGVFVHPRPGLITEYLSERWFELWDFALRECKRLGLECNIYDENSYPAGFAGGHVSARLPHASAQYVHAMIHGQAPVRCEGELLGAWKLGEPTTPLPPGANLDDALSEAPVLTLALRRASGSPWTAWFPMTDITRPEVARDFIATTYEPYAEHFAKDFGTDITAIFCDEPLIATAGAYSPVVGLPLSRFFLKEFHRDHGYDLQPKLADLFVDQPGAHATRFDYFLTLQRLWTRNFLKPLHDWCAEHHLRLTGHFMEHEWPDPVLSPSCMEGYRWMHMPGVDLLTPQFDFQHPERSARYVLTFRELNSAANQLGLNRRLCETHGVGGYGATFEEFKRVADWVMVHGVNFVNQHLSYQTISGARKYDYPQTFSDHSAWWKSYRVVADHFARLSVALSQGAQRNRILVLHSTTSGWVHYNPAQPGDLIKSLRASEARLVQWLVDHQVDFDFADELLLADFGRVDGPFIHAGERQYSVIVVPEGMENWCDSTRVLIEKYLAGRGALLALREPPSLVNGRPASFESAAPWRKISSLEEMQTALDSLAPPLITMANGNHLPALVGHQMREFENGDCLHLLANSGVEPIRGQARVAGAGVCALDTLTGEATPLPFRRDGAHILVPLDLPVAGHALWLVSGEPSTVSTPAESKPHVIEIAEFTKIERATQNVLALDFCDLTVAGQTHPGLYVTRANRLCWQAHGFDHDVWDRAIQFRRNYLDFQPDADSGFEATYRFDAAPFRCDDLRLAVEHPELYQITFNGHPVSFESASSWLDETIRAASVGSLLRSGENTITLQAHPFHILCEIDRIYLLGDFALEPSAPGFRMLPPAALTLGDWTRQGLPQYPGAVRYTATLTLEKPAASIVVETPHWSGSVIEASIDGRPAGPIAFPPYQLQLPGSFNPGTHELTLEVIGTPVNMFGPHFWKVHSWPGPGAWDRDIPPIPAPGADYQLTSYGLLGPIRVSLS